MGQEGLGRRSDGFGDGPEGPRPTGVILLCSMCPTAQNLGLVLGPQGRGGTLQGGKSM